MLPLATRAVLPLLAVPCLTWRGSPQLCSSELSSLKVVELKEQLRAAGLRVSGNKKELVARLTNAGSAGDDGAEDAPLGRAPQATAFESPAVVVTIMHCRQ